MPREFTDNAAVAITGGGSTSRFRSTTTAATPGAPEYVLSDHLQIHFIELPKNRLRDAAAVDDELDAWCFFFENEGLSEVDMTVLLHKHSPIGKAHEVYREFTADRELMDMAEAKEKWRRDVDSRLHAARTEGKAEGKTEGRTETRFDVARRMLDEGLDIDMIRRITGLSDQEIRELREGGE